MLNKLIKELGVNLGLDFASEGFDYVTFNIGNGQKFAVYEKYDEIPWKWTVPWSIETPKGFSLLFTHPLNRMELPFVTMSGIVDTDEYECPVNLPFLIREGFMGVIPKGTPIAQVIPIKREKWSSNSYMYR